jgi:choline transport protein
LVATASSLGASFIVNIIALLHPTYESQPWHIFLLYVGFSLLGWIVNVFGAKILDVCNKAALFWSLTGAVVLCIVCLSTASPEFRTGKEVFGTFVNETGW